MICEDYPCCGHTDGLGCDWVSPNEVVPCDICIEARATRPYHNRVDGCPTLRARAIEQSALNVPEGFECEECGEGDSIHADYEYLCYNCGVESEYYAHQMDIESGYYDN